MDTMTDAITLHIIGEPAPQGSKKHMGHGIMVEASKKVKPWREAVHWQAREQYQGPILDGTVIIEEALFFVKRPLRLKKRLDVISNTKPDVDKVLRATLDALTGVVWTDDCKVGLVVRLEKRYANPGQPMGARIAVRQLPE